MDTEHHNLTDYEAAVRDFRLEVPKRFNFAREVIGRWAEDRDKLAMLWLGPGGEVLASDEIYRAISDFQKNAHKSVVASMGNLAASGGYYVSAPCQWIIANPLTITGSIGVIMHSWNYRGLMNKVGLQPETYKSGKFKDMLSGERNPEEIPPEEREMVQGLINETYDRFKSVVAKGRAEAHERNKRNAGSDQGRTLALLRADRADGAEFPFSPLLTKAKYFLY